MFKWNFLYFNLCLFPLVLLLDIVEKAWLCLLNSLLYQMFIHTAKILPEPFLLQTEQSRMSQPLLVFQVLQGLNHCCGPWLDLTQYVHVSLVPESPGLDTAL